ncbi:ABC transporter permease [Dyadobacter frigoris]|uniref:FtsX-like permease family protein n=1 Tax=Dyadobacter frigoris TaxID=2576211 RepID=A0A4U6D2M3_9BACT|nr:ABC transporter permease [Dyadobacter frigoris]TKT88114.1 FtsX-like permease family protein [Dyadobacter frigoris]GLU53727.1 ABC transporter permease [Dyadobacter frigoris]
MLKNYFQIAARNLKINRSYAILNIFGLGLGMAGAVLIFLFIQFHLSTDRHQPDFDRMYKVVLDLHLDEGVEHESGSAYALSTALSQDYSQIEKVGFISKLPNVTLSANSGGKVKRFIEKENVAYADQGYINIFSFDWIKNNGSILLSEPFTVVLSEKMALKYFGTSDVIGKTIRLNNTNDLRIVGVLKDQNKPTDLDFNIYISLPTLKKLDLTNWPEQYGWISSKNFTFVKKTKGSNSADIEKALKSNGTKYYGENSKYYQHKLQPLSDVHFDERYGGQIRRSILWVLAGVGFFLLIIASINFINLATAQALKRAKEIGIRKVLGSTKGQLFWQFMAETALVTVLASVLALIFVMILLPSLNNWTHTKAFHFGMLFQFEVVSFLLLAVMVVIGFAGFYPAVIISGFNPIAALKSKLSTQQIGGIGLRRSLITVQLIIAQILVIGTLVLVLQLKFFKNTDLGFDQNAVITIPLPKSDTLQKTKDALRNDMLQYPDIKSVSYQYEAPASNMGFGGSVRFDNRAEWEKFVIRDRFGDENYLQTYKMQLLAGRSLMKRDSVVEFVINEELMKRLGVRDPQLILGKQLEDGASGFKGDIVGVVKSFHLKSLQEAVEPCVIFANPKLYKEVAVKIDTRNLAQSIQHINQAWQKSYPDEVFSYEFVDEKIAKFYEKEEQLTSLIRSFAMVAILICCLGLYGMVSFMVTQKTKEIGVRKVLGASVSNIVSLFGKEFLILVTVAFCIASPIAWYAMKNWLNHFAYRIDLEWWILASGGIIILLITLITVGYKVVIAALMNPVKSLASE